MKKNIHLLLLICFTLSCGQRNEVDLISGSRFYKDYDVFKRAGLDEIDSASLEIPFIQEYSRTDSIITLRIYDSYFTQFETVRIPTIDGIRLKAKYNYTDAPNWIYATINEDKIIRYGYNLDPYDKSMSTRKEVFLYNIVPDLIEIITEDTIKTILFQNYLEDKYNIDVNDKGDWSKMKHKIILPFKAEVDTNWGFMILKDNVHIEVIRDSADYYTQTIYISNAYGSDEKEKFGGSYHFVSSNSYPRPFKKYRNYLNPTRGM